MRLAPALHRRPRHQCASRSADRKSRVCRVHLLHALQSDAPFWHSSRPHHASCRLLALPSDRRKIMHPWHTQPLLQRRCPCTHCCYSCQAMHAATATMRPAVRRLRAAVATPSERCDWTAVTALDCAAYSTGAHACLAGCTHSTGAHACLAGCTHCGRHTGGGSACLWRTQAR